MKLERKFIFYFLLILVVGGISIGGGGWLYLSNLPPDIEGSVVASGVNKNTQIIRDKWGDQRQL